MLRSLAVAAVLACLTTVAAAEPAAPPYSTFDAEARKRVLEAYEARRAREGDAYDPRTELRAEDGGPRYVNRLILEPSPYLRQHAHNPVDWRPWGAAALAEARATGRPIFLSVGYSTCHWCHVMEAESFDAPEVAALLNQHFIPIKVDREELPAVDETYMTATMIMTGGGGWPNSLWLTPEGEPFFAGGYFPKPDFLQLLQLSSASWREEQLIVRAEAKRISAIIQSVGMQSAEAAKVGADAHRQAVAALAERHNDFFGGFSDSAQFPMEVFLRYLTDRWRRDGDAATLAIVELTADAIVAGGIHDHAGGGFHRYAVDPEWKTPHFEKMLYNQAQLVSVLVELWQATGKAPYRRAASRALDFVLREMTAEDGAFFSALDADSALPGAGETLEGAYYLWELQDAAEAIGAEQAGKLGLGAPAPLESGGTLWVEMDAIDALPDFDGALETLRRKREERPRPLRDEKVIGGWNGMMIRAFAQAGSAFERDDYLGAAKRAADAIWARLWRGEAGLARLSADGASDRSPPAALNDYAWLGLGYLALADATGEAIYLERARMLAGEIEKRFSTEAGRLKLSEQDGPFGPTFELGDQALPTGESSALELFARLSRREADFAFRQRAERTLAAMSGRLAEYPAGWVVALIGAGVLQEGESEPERALAGGRVRAEAVRRSGDIVEIKLRIAEGWHVNSDAPLSDLLIPTLVDGDDVQETTYPSAIEARLGFQDEPLMVFEGVPMLRVQLRPDASGRSTVVRLQIQACSDALCLAPENVSFRLGPEPHGGR